MRYTKEELMNLSEEEIEAEKIRINNLTEEELEAEFGDYNDYYSFEPSILSIPKVCRSCGGPYPDCTSSCKMFDD